MSGPNPPSPTAEEPSNGSVEAGLGSPPPQARAERADKARNRARILAAAAEAFGESGIETQMDDVAARAGLGVGTLYRHFPTKDALMVALVEGKFTRILEVTRRGIAREDGEPFEIFADVMREGAEVAAADATAQDMLMRGGHALWFKVEPTLTELQAATQVLVDRAQSAGTMRSDVSAADVPMIMCGVSATMPVDRWDWRRYLDLVLDGLRAR